MTKLNRTATQDRPQSVTHALKSGDGRYAFGRSIYLVVRGRSALWEYQFRQDGRLRTMSLGSAVARSPLEQPVTITEARAKREAAWIARRNGEAVPTGARGVRFSAAATDYLKNHAAEWSPKQSKDHKRRIELYTAPLSAKPVNRITVEDVAAVLRPIWTGPSHGRGSKLRGILEKIFAANEVEPNPASWSRLQHKLSTKSQHTVSYPAVPSADLPGLMADLEKDDSTITRAILFATLTATRQMETLGARWCEIDFKHNAWIVPALRTKKRIEHAVPLTAKMIACLGPRGADDEYIFPSRRGGHLSHASTGPVLAEYKRFDTDGNAITLHGMRSTFGVWAHAQETFDKITIDRCLAHSLSKVDEAYYRGKKITPEYLESDTFKLRRELMEAWCEFATTLCS